MTDAGTASGPMTLRELVRRLGRHALLMGVVFLVVVLGVGAWTLLSAPRYRSTAVVRILDPDRSPGLGDQLSSVPGAELMGLGRDELETEIGVLRSWRIAQAVVDSTALTVQVTRPGGVRSGVLRVTALGDPDRQAGITLDPAPGGGYQASVTEPDAGTTSLGAIPAGGTVEWAGYRLALQPAVGPGAPAPGAIRIEIARRDEAVQALREDLVVRREEGGSRLVEVTYTSTDREAAAAVVNAAVAEYVAYKTTVERGEAGFTTSELREKLQEYRARLTEAEDALLRYKEDHAIYLPEEQATQQIRRLAELQIQVDAVEVERDALRRLLTLIGDRARSLPPDSAAATYRQLATFPSLIANRAIQDLLLALLELENARSALRVRRTDQNQDVAQLTERIAELETQLYRVGTDYLESLSGQHASVTEALAGQEADLESMPGRELAFDRLVRGRNVLGEAVLLLERQLRLAEVQDAVRDEGVRIVDPGLVAHEDDPLYPRPLVNLFLGVVLAAALALGAGLVRDLWEA